VSTPPTTVWTSQTGEVVNGVLQVPDATQSAAWPVGVKLPPVMAVHIDLFE
jgi:hypothetical protein